MVRPPQKDGIELAVHAEGGTWVAMGPTELQQVLLNLILNARRAMGRRGGRLSIEASRPNVGCVRIDVADTGPGIPQDLLPRIFEPFVTRHGEDPSTPGTGLGLAICRDLTHRVDGRIEVVRTGPEGTVMRVELPEITR